MNKEPLHPDEEDFSEDYGEPEAGRCPNVDVLVVDGQVARFAPKLDDWNTTTLLACVSEDPVDWAEIAAVWPRYQTGPSDKVDYLKVQRVSNLNAWSSLISRPHGSHLGPIYWILGDTCQQRSRIPIIQFGCKTCD